MCAYLLKLFGLHFLKNAEHRVGRPVKGTFDRLSIPSRQIICTSWGISVQHECIEFLTDMSCVGRHVHEKLKEYKDGETVCGGGRLHLNPMRSQGFMA